MRKRHVLVEKKPQRLTCRVQETGPLGKPCARIVVDKQFLPENKYESSVDSLDIELVSFRNLFPRLLSWKGSQIKVLHLSNIRFDFITVWKKRKKRTESIRDVFARCEITVYTLSALLHR
ncbi:Uncharacterized protein TCM_016453 [Theobroma cacao]|uniref:Uncharacterized protein n=1 Tax=Theobroma cacao TaxID=3641 RepID=A0A061G6G0_THECC|nr:Uncharacterized protein TCM_016453 [Theobroma cacao]